MLPRMDPNNLLSPENMPKLMFLSAIVAVAFAALIYNFTHNIEISIATGVFLIVADYLGLKMLLGKDDR